jgi:mannosylglycoprotein endo-beta-mannosidase
LKAQLVNYDQYRGLAEGFTSHMWDWYTGFIIWKTQNPWTAMRGQMYDYYLDPNACLYGLQNGSAPFHIMYNPVNGDVMVANNTFKARRSMMMVVKIYDMEGNQNVLTQVFADINATTVKKYFSVKGSVDKAAAKEGCFLSLQLLDENKKTITDNTYWIPDSKGAFSGLQKMKAEDLAVNAKYLKPGKVEVTLVNKENSVLAFFNRISLVDADSKTRVLPTFYSDNYVTVLPGEEKKVIVDYNNINNKKLVVTIDGWNSANTTKTIQIEQ